jgi:hypothetical protein
MIRYAALSKHVERVGADRFGPLPSALLRAR